MSRSTKKNAIVKDVTKNKKQSANRKHRRVNKILLEEDKELKKSEELTNQYDVCDWKFIANKNDRFFKKFKRK